MSANSTAKAAAAPVARRCLAPLIPGSGVLSLAGVPQQKVAKALAADCNQSLAVFFVVSLSILAGVCLLIATPHLLRGRFLWQGNGAPPVLEEKKASPASAVDREQLWAEAASLRQLEPEAGVVARLRTRMRNLNNGVLLQTVPLIDLTVGQVGVLAIYSALVIFISTFQVGSWELNPRRFGFVAVAQVPPVFVLAMKNTPFAFLGHSYERLNFLHRFVGRIFVLFGAIHGAYFYTAEMQAEGMIALEGPVLTGTVMLIALGVIFLSSLKPIRQRLYQTFLVLHIGAYITILFGLYYHVEATRPYLYSALAVVTLDHLLKALKTHNHTATFTSLPGDLTRIEVPQLRDGWKAGQHVWIRVLYRGNCVEKHPFTIASAPEGRSAQRGATSLTLYAKPAGDFTRRLDKLVRSEPAFEWSRDVEKGGYSSRIHRRLNVTVEGPYGGTGLVDFREFPAVMLVAGGSGFTFAMGVLEELVGARLAGTCRTTHVTVVWTVRQLDMLEAFVEPVARTLRDSRSTDLTVSFRLHVTSNDLQKPPTFPVPDGVHLIPARPQIENTLTALVDQVVDDGMHGVGVGVCGPLALVKGCRRAAGKVDATRVGGVVFHSEMFGW